MDVRNTSGRVLAAVIIVVALILAGTALGITALASNHSSGSPTAVVIPQTATPHAPKPAPRIKIKINNNNIQQNNSNIPEVAPDQGPGRGSVNVRISQREIIVFKIDVRYYFQGGWFIITGPTTYIGTIRPPGFSGGEPKARTGQPGTQNDTSPPTTQPGKTPPTTQPSTTPPTTPTTPPTQQPKVPSTSRTTPSAPSTNQPSAPTPTPSAPPTNQPTTPTTPSAPQHVMVPNVVGDDAATAQQVLSAAGFAVKVVGSNAAGGATTGTVFSQVPSAGGTAPEGSTMIVYLR